MAEKKKWTVKRRHQGDRFYEIGETREAARHEVEHLIGTVLEEQAGKVAPASAEKAEPEPKNKAEDAAPANKAATGRKAKSKGQ